MNPELKSFLLTTLAVVVGITLSNAIVAPIMASFSMAAPATSTATSTATK